MRHLRFYLIACLLALAGALPASAREIVIKNFNEQVTVNPDGTIEVMEFIEAQFIGTGYHGLYRTIPVEYYGERW